MSTQTREIQLDVTVTEQVGTPWTDCPWVYAIEYNGNELVRYTEYEENDGGRSENNNVERWKKADAELAMCTLDRIDKGWRKKYADVRPEDVSTCETFFLTSDRIDDHEFGNNPLSFEELMKHRATKLCATLRPLRKQSTAKKIKK